MGANTAPNNIFNRSGDRDECSSLGGKKTEHVAPGVAPFDMRLQCGRGLQLRWLLWGRGLCTCAHCCADRHVIGMRPWPCNLEGIIDSILLKVGLSLSGVEDHAEYISYGCGFVVRLGSLCRLPFGNSDPWCNSLPPWTDGTELRWDHGWRWPVVAVTYCVWADGDVPLWDRTNPRRWRWKRSKDKETAWSMSHGSLLGWTWVLRDQGSLRSVKETCKGRWWPAVAAGAHTHGTFKHLWLNCVCMYRIFRCINRGRVFAAPVFFTLINK